MEHFSLANKNHHFALGRDGGLTEETNILTYSFIAYLYGPQGSYRSILHEFGIPGLNDPRTHLVFSNNHIYSDIDLENSIYWLPSGRMLTEKNGSISLSTHITTKYFPGNVTMLIKKLITDARLLQSLKAHRISAHQTYTLFTERTIELLENDSISTPTLLLHYKHIVKINYLYEFFANMLGGIISNPTYSHDNDLLIGENQQFFEQQFLDHGFNLLLSNPITIVDKPHAPRTMPESTLGDIHKDFVIELQTMKNNMRVQYTALLYKLAQQIDAHAMNKGIIDISNKTLGELVEVPSKIEYLYS
ncbi:hypothetical protein COX05_04740 [candidate division WWE3 bacterium CG22_combo_CG10-13_8_21_14_all_39_12]|uniref:Uncharacterized protein n=2 Tax=Katanobacteria TaxID=422282 RepID=A0A2M7X1C0_UNCKA|nr:MAG: hypothetical protein COX05_04740 [candidate division WWE3 bacterium CG22_combo_CG10-13_8_21_14_all_39_12]PJA39781.1 MAG: hypothetical protein CO179_04480 [candidate division WWE3 bacterium CG_4_9_14_3_um_filter_39_7]